MLLCALMLSWFLEDFVLFMNWKVASHSDCHVVVALVVFPFFLIQSYSSENFVKTEAKSIVRSEYEISLFSNPLRR